MRFLFLVFVFVGLGIFSAKGQSVDTVSTPNRYSVVKTDKNRKESLPSLNRPSPKRVGLYSAIIPGLGQVMNHQYWKLPIIYGGLATAAYFIYDYRKNYNEFRSIYIGRVSNDPDAFKRHPELTSLGQVQNAMNYYSHYLDLSVVLTVAGYGLQIIDALVFANLKDFDISPDISLRLQPILYNNGGIGLGMVMNF